MNINKLKFAEQSAADAGLTRAIVETVRHPLLVLDENLHILLANPAFFKLFKLNKQETESQSLLSICDGARNTAEIQQQLKTILQDKSKFEELHISLEFPGIGLKPLILNSRILKPAIVKSVHILLAIEDVTHISRCND
ncbi:PAS domain-containing protein [Methyloprofundus sedimenti]|uniref:PAS domain-containing protein n=1 Tax=Methyloprofundus sedimenti TaxID=1420851 RepID=UPI0009B5DF03